MIRAYPSWDAEDFRTGPVCLDDPTASWLGQWHDRNRWNGFLCPSFDPLTVVAILTWLNAAYAEVGQIGFRYDWSEDGDLILTDPEWERECKATGEAYQPDVLEPDEDGLYGLGAFGWVWTEVWVVSD